MVDALCSFDLEPPARIGKSSVHSAALTMHSCSNWQSSGCLETVPSQQASRFCVFLQAPWGDMFIYSAIKPSLLPLPLLRCCFIHLHSSTLLLPG
jgi:hypothetical protein